MPQVWKEGDRVSIITRPVTEDDRKKSRYFEHMAGLKGTVQNVYEENLIAVKIDEAALSSITAGVHQMSVQRMREKFLSNIGEEAKKSLTKEELDFNAHFMQLVHGGDLVKAD